MFLYYSVALVVGIRPNHLSRLEPSRSSDQLTKNPRSPRMERNVAQTHFELTWAAQIGLPPLGV